MEQTADKAFVEFWSKNQDQAAEAGFSASTTRRLHHWLMPAYGLGACREYLNPGEHADWITALDHVVVAIDPAGQSILSVMREQGDRVFRQGASDKTIQQMPEARRRLFCATELAAIRQFLKEL